MKYQLRQNQSYRPFYIVILISPHLLISYIVQPLPYDVDLLLHQTINLMKRDLSFRRKLFSHSIKCMLPQQPPSESLSPLKFKTVEVKQKHIAKSLHKKNIEQIIRLEQQHKAYEGMIDEVLKKYAEEQKLNLLMTKLKLKHNYKNYRIINSGQQKLITFQQSKCQNRVQKQDDKFILLKEQIKKKQAENKRHIKTEILNNIVDKKIMEAKSQSKAFKLPVLFKYNLQSYIQKSNDSNKSLLSHKSNGSYILPQQVDPVKMKPTKRVNRSQTEC